VQQDGRVREEVLEARRRGVIFDIGHGSGSFGFRTAEAMLTAGFFPDVISSDVHALSIRRQSGSSHQRLARRFDAPSSECSLEKLAARTRSRLESHSGTDSSLTLRWREMDSNFWFRAK
jgi:hypothetical protein